jgi:hypothetical protein
MERTNPITPAGFAALRARYQQLFAVERPAVVETVSWAAGNGDRSENGDYIYGKQKLRAIDRELGQLSKKMKFANVLDPAKQPDRSRVFFGATILLADIDERTNSPSPLRLTAKAVRLRTSPLKGRGKWRLASPLQGRGYGALAVWPRRSW